ncbi:MAG TPA: hypothetical protein VGB83_09630 [Actinomycetota bacterium]
MKVNKRLVRGVCVAALLAAAIAPSAAQAAAPTISDLVVYGNATPDLPGSDRLYPSGDPHGTGQAGLAYFKGKSSPGAIITVTVTADPPDPQFASVAYSTVAAPAGVSEEVDGYEPGDFGAGTPNPNGGDLYQGIPVTNLGDHEASDDEKAAHFGSPAIPDDPETPEDESVPAVPGDPSLAGGASTLTFSFTATDPSTDETSAPVEATLTKYAAAPNDNGPPFWGPITLGGSGGSKYALKWPPAQWCHWGCLSTFGGIGIGDPRAVLNGSTTGTTQVSGGVFDYTTKTEPHQANSEIAYVKLEVLHGEADWFPPLANIISRSGSGGYWSLEYRITQFEAGDYTMRATAIDAWGNPAPDQTANFTVHAM